MSSKFESWLQSARKTATIMRCFLCDRIMLCNAFMITLNVVPVRLCGLAEIYTDSISSGDLCGNVENESRHSKTIRPPSNELSYFLFSRKTHQNYAQRKIPAAWDNWRRIRWRQQHESNKHIIVSNKASLMTWVIESTTSVGSGIVPVAHRQPEKCTCACGRRCWHVVALRVANI